MLIVLQYYYYYYIPEIYIHIYFKQFGNTNCNYTTFLWFLDIIKHKKLLKYIYIYIYENHYFFPFSNVGSCENILVFKLGQFGVI